MGGRFTRTARATIVASIMACALTAAPMANASAPWTIAGTGTVGAKALTLAAGARPTASSINTPAGNVTLTWAASSLSGGGSPATGYLVSRFDARTGLLALATACSTLGATTCSESSVPSTGTWQYKVTPSFRSWTSAASALSGEVNVGAPVPVAGSLVTTNGTGTAGKPDQGDTVSVRFSQKMNVATLCSTWAGNGTNQSISASNVVSVVLTRNGSGAGRDSLTVTTTSAACGGAAHFGTVNLGANYVPATTTCSGVGSAASTVAWDAVTSTLTLTLGACGTTTTVAGSALTYTPNAALRNSTGGAITGTVTTASTTQF